LSKLLEGNIMNNLNTSNTGNTSNTISASTAKWLLHAALVGALLAGCGGGGGGDSNEARGIDKSSSDLMVFMKGLIAMDENSEAVDTNPLTLVMDNSGDSAAL
jgi:hypothetical protein